MPNKISPRPTIYFLVLFMLIGFAQIKAFAITDTPTPTTSPITTIIIDHPKQSELIESSGFIISGKAPESVLIAITISDEDTGNLFQVHQPVSVINDTTTSDSDGNWLYIPTNNLVPGKFSVVASYSDSTKGTIFSERIFFTISDISGSIRIIPTSVFVAGIIILLLIISGMIAFYLRFRQKKLFIATSKGYAPLKVVAESENTEIVSIDQSQQKAAGIAPNLEPSFLASPVIPPQPKNNSKPKTDK